MIHGDSRLLLKDVVVSDFMLTYAPLGMGEDLRELLARQHIRSTGWSAVMHEAPDHAAWCADLEESRIPFRRHCWISSSHENRSFQPKLRLVTSSPAGVVHGSGQKIIPVAFEFYNLTKGRLSRTQIPLSLALELNHHFATRGGLGIDPFSGTGTFALASWLFGCDFIAIEIDPKAHTIATDRINSVVHSSPSASDTNQIAKWLLENPDHVDRVLSRIHDWSVVASRMKAIAAEEEKKLRALVLKHIADDASGERKHEKLIKGLYKWPQ